MYPLGIPASTKSRGACNNSVRITINNMVIVFSKFNYSDDFTYLHQLLPDLDHGVGVESAIVQEGAAGLFAFFGCHLAHLWIYGHGIATVLHTTGEVVVIKFWVIGEEGWENLLDREGTMHTLFVEITLTERIKEVGDVVVDVHEVVVKVGIQICHFLNASALEAFIVCRGAGTERNILNQLFRQGTTRICNTITKKLCVFQFTTFFLYPIQRILEWYLLIRTQPSGNRKDFS